MTEPLLRSLVLAALLLLLAGCGGSATPSASSIAAKPVPPSSPNLSAPPKPAAGGPSASARVEGGAGWLTYHGNGARTGVGPPQPAIGSPKQLWATPLDGVVYGEPLVAGGRVFVVTESDTAYALEANDGKVVWQQHVGEPVPRSSLLCGNIDPSGFTATPAIDAGKGLLYAAGRFQPTHHELFAFDLASGAVRFHRRIDPPGADPRYLQLRSALLVANGRVYVAFGGNFGDCGPYKGWVLGAPLDSANGDVLSYAVPTQREGGIWAPPGPTLDANGDLLVATGNTEGAGQFDYGNAVIRLSANLAQEDYWAPTDWAELGRRDTDIGSISPTVVQDDQVFQSGKNGIGYLLRASKLGNIGGELFKAPICRAAFGGTASQPPMLYVSCTDGLAALRIGQGSFQTAWHASAQAPNAPPLVTYGSVWQIDAGALLQLDPASGQLRNRAPLPTPVVAHFLAPAADGGRLFVTSGRTVLAFGG